MALLILACGAPTRPIESPEPPTPEIAFAPPSTITIGETFACAIDDEARVVCWGGGELDLGGFVTTPHPPTRVDGLLGAVEIALGSSDILCARNEAGHVECTRLRRCFPGDDCESIAFAPRRVTHLANARALALGDGVGCAIVDDGQVRCWGRVPAELLPSPLEGDWTDAAVPVQVAPSRAIAIDERTLCTIGLDGEVRCGERELGRYEQVGARLLVHGDTTCAYVVGGSTACATANGALETLSPIPTIDGAPPACLGDLCVRQCWAPLHNHVCFGDNVEFALTTETGCARRMNGTVACSGNNSHGQLGTAPIVSVPEPRAIDVPPSAQIAASAGTVCSLGTDGGVSCWGRDWAPHLLGDGAARIALTQSTSMQTAEDGHGRLFATDLRLAVVGTNGEVRVLGGAERREVPEIDDAADVAFFGSTIAIRLRNGDLAFSRDIAPGEHLERRRVPRGVRDLAGYQWLGCVLHQNRRLECWSENDGPVDPMPLNALRGIDEIAANGLGICARMGRRIVCRDMDGIDRVLNAREDIDGVAYGSDQRVCAIASHRAVCSVADTLTPIDGTEGAEQVVVGYGFACVRTTEGAVRCWGNNAYGAIAIPHASDTLVDIRL
jgi:alpha-tubulin suppressor-like RCC1 family protein